MQILHIQTLTIVHAVKLLEFETQNRAWFESQIEARDASFYSLTGVKDHIEQILHEADRGKCRSYLVMNEQNQIVARANLKEIDLELGSAEVGYRVGQDFIRQGVASMAVAHLSAVAQQELGLMKLHAIVIEHNHGSQKVLRKAGFEIVKSVSAVAKIGSQYFDGFHFYRSLKEGR